VPQNCNQLFASDQQLPGLLCHLGHLLQNLQDMFQNVEFGASRTNDRVSFLEVASCQGLEFFHVPHSSDLL
jgi:hypothetical protein